MFLASHFKRRLTERSLDLVTGITGHDGKCQSYVKIAIQLIDMFTGASWHNYIPPPHGSDFLTVI